MRRRARIVRVDGAPLAGATVGLYPATVVTDAAVFFEIRRSRGPRFGTAIGSDITVHHAGLEHVFVPRDEPSGDERLVDLDLVDGPLTVEVLDANG